MKRSPVLGKMIRAALMCFLLALLGTQARAQRSELRIGTRSEFVPDPHAQWSATLMYYYVQYLGFLTELDENDKVKLTLAKSIQPLSSSLWEVKLKPGLKFSNGTPLTARDVAASYERMHSLPKSTFSGLLSGIEKFEVLDELTLHIVTSEPYPTIPAMFTQLAIVPADIASTASAADFNGKAANVGSAPYKFEEYVPGDRLVLQRDELYSGPKARWDRVTFKFLGNGAARLAALLAGDVDVIDDVSPDDVTQLKANSKVSVFSGPASAVNFFVIDSGRDVSPFIADNDGKPMTVNPFKDKRVRQAFSLAIDRDIIRDRIMGGYAYTNNQIVRQGFGGYSDKLPEIKADLTTARKLLADAGHGDGFQLTMHCPEGRYPNGAKICQAVAQMLSRLKIKTTLDMMPRSVYFSKMTDATGARGSFLLFGFGASSGGEATILQQGIHTYDPDKKLGAWNMGRYSNAETDRLIEQSLTIMDAPHRYAVQEQAMIRAMEDVAVIPFQTQPVIVATRKGLTYDIYANAYTLADAVSKESDK